MNPLPPSPLPPAPVPQKSSPVLWALLGCGLFLFAFIGVIGAGAIAVLVLRAKHQIPQQQTAAYVVEAAPNTTAPAAALKPLPDADVLAARMKWDQDIYQKLRDESLAAYQKLHPNPAPPDAHAQAALKLLAYLATWGDYYGEGLWQQYNAHREQLSAENADPAVFERMGEVYDFEDTHSSNEESAMNSVRDAIDFQSSSYPAYFKFLVDKAVLSDLFEARSSGDLHPSPGSALEKIPALLDLTTQTYAELLREHLPNTILFRAGSNLLATVNDDETTLKAASAGLDQAFATADKGDPLADVLKGNFYTEDAWCARGGGWASSVTADGWKRFADRLATANQILTAVYAAHPDQTGTPRVMMTVVLGQQQSRDQMELWYQRGLKLNPDPIPYHMAKRWYLLPRWYGSDEIEWTFGLECAKSDDWATKTPTMLLECVSDAADNNSGLYANPETWAPIEHMLREYLDHFPNAVTYRSRFLKCAVQGGHWTVAAEQMKILGDNWDRSIFEGNEYEQTRQLIAAHQGTDN